MVVEASEFFKNYETKQPLTLPTMTLMSSGIFTPTNAISFESSRKRNSIQRLPVSDETKH
jgi:hypothetical protein